MKFSRIARFCIFSAVFFCFSVNVQATDEPYKCVITIESVLLKKDSGEWITIIDPDHQVDLMHQDPTVSFFNNGRRVPPGKYSNFKILLSKTIKAGTVEKPDLIYDAKSSEIAIYGNRDLAKILSVSASSFISVWFNLDLSNTVSGRGPQAEFTPPRQVRQAKITIDDQEVVVPGSDITLSY